MFKIEIGSRKTILPTPNKLRQPFLALKPKNIIFYRNLNILVLFNFIFDLTL